MYSIFNYKKKICSFIIWREKRDSANISNVNNNVNRENIYIKAGFNINNITYLMASINKGTDTDTGDNKVINEEINNKKII